MLMYCFAILLCSSLVTPAVLERETGGRVVISAPNSAPTRAAGPIDPAFAGFAFEERSFYYYAGTPSNPNTFSQNLIKAITDKTQTQPIIRVGGTSLDHSHYNPDQTKAIVIPPSQETNGIPQNLTLGPSYFDRFAVLPNARYIVDIPLATNNLSNSILFAKAAYKRVGASSIFALEIGNEPNVYPKEIRPSWTISNYVAQWLRWSSAISEALKLPNKIYQAVALSSETAPTLFPGGPPGDPWKVPNIFKHGLDNHEDRIKSVSMHYYQTKANRKSDLQHDLMNHSAVVRGSAFVDTAVQYLKKQHPPIPLALAEVGSTLGNISNNDALEAVLGSALWQVDFYLYSMSIGVARINYQSGLTFGFSLWNPDYQNTSRSVHPSFYGHIFAAEFIGPGRHVRVANIDLNRAFLSAYAAYDGDTLSRIAIANLELWSDSNSFPPQRPSQKVVIPVRNAAVKTVEVKKLTSPHGGTAAANQSITWGGMRWSDENDGKGVQVLNDTEILHVRNKQVEVEVSASEAVMVFLRS